LYDLALFFLSHFLLNPFFTSLYVRFFFLAVRSNLHPGNLRYHQAKLKLQESYLQLPFAAKKQKTELSRQLLRTVHSWGGRFLQWCDRKVDWEEAPISKARNKCAQALREVNSAENRAAKRQRYGTSYRSTHHHHHLDHNDRNDLEQPMLMYSRLNESLPNGCNVISSSLPKATLNSFEAVVSTWLQNEKQEDELVNQALIGVESLAQLPSVVSDSTTISPEEAAQQTMCIA
jgi:hypothetical protein